ncbi:hypothetical protein DL95DRAFT_524362 [Leptodontidium sp. 2 PMI_412]|nr:hypothetical protein DL95DRAFT_524362 [Leptodontidium sp. 2 PMI_412]
MNDAMTGTRYEKNYNLLTQIQDSWSSDTVSPARVTDVILGENNIKLVQGTVRPISLLYEGDVFTSSEPCLGNRFIFQLQGHAKAYLSRDIQKYNIGDADPAKVVQACDNEKTAAYSTSLILRGNNEVTRALTLCSPGFFSSGTYESGSREVAPPPAELQPKDTNGNVNPDWPGNPANFIRAKEKQEDSATDILLLALGKFSINESRRPKRDEGVTLQTVSTVEAQGVSIANNPQNYAWAALSMYLARNGAKMGYSTGQARPLDAPIAGPAGGPSGVIGKVRKRISSARTTLMAKYFDA